MTDWDEVRVFLNVARERSFSRAARVLRVSQPTLSRRVADLEQRLGLPLFLRSHRGLSLTEDAQRLLPAAERAERELLAFERLASEGGPHASGSVRMATLEELARHVLIPALDDFARRWPKIELQILGEPGALSLDRGDADIAVRPTRPTSGDLVAHKVAELPYAAFASEQLIERHAREVRRGQLGQLPWLALVESLSHLPEVRWVLRTAEHPPRVRLQSTRALAEAAAAGVGAAVLPVALAEGHRQLRRLDPPAPAVVTRRLWVVTPRELRQLPRIRVVIDWLAELFARA